MKSAILKILIIVLAGLTPASAATDRPLLEGVWRVAGIETLGPGASTNLQPQPGLFIFTKRHYSLMYVTTAEPRTPGAGLQLSDSESLAAFNSFAGNSGEYEREGDRITIHPMVARSPGYMGGASDVYSVRVEGATLILRNQASDARVWVGGKLQNFPQVRSGTLFRLTRVE